MVLIVNSSLCTNQRNLNRTLTGSYKIIEVLPLAPAWQAVGTQNYLFWNFIF